jgi:hypothetical protein
MTNELIFRFANFYLQKKEYQKVFQCYWKQISSDTAPTVFGPVENVSRVSDSVAQAIHHSSCADFRVYFNLAQLFLFHSPSKSCDGEQSAATTNERAMVVKLLEKSLVFNPSLLESYANLSGIYIKMDKIMLALKYSMQGLLAYYKNPEGNDGSKDQLLFLISNFNIAMRKLTFINSGILFTWKCMFPNLSIDEMKKVIWGKTELSTNDEQKLIFTERTEKSQNPMKTIYTVICLKVGSKYGANYVNNLYLMIVKGLKESSVRFICLTDDATDLLPEIEVELLPTSDVSQSKGTHVQEKWWKKINIFSPQIVEKYSKKETTEVNEQQSDGNHLQYHSHWLYLDLDTILFGDISSLWSSSSTSSLPDLLILNCKYFHNESNERKFRYSSGFLDSSSFTL